MPASITATKLGILQSKVTATTASTAGPTSLDVLTIVHGINRVPDKIWHQLRCIRSVVSNGLPGLILQSANASLALLAMTSPDGGAAVADFDIFCEHTHTTVR